MHDRLWVFRYALPTSLVGMHLVHRMNTLPARLGCSGGYCEALLGVSRVCQPEERSVAGTYGLRESNNERGRPPLSQSVGYT